MKTIITKGRPYFLAAIILIVGIVLGGMIFGGGSAAQDGAAASAETVSPEVWTCSMHPQIRQDEPGLCPLCAMDLIPLTSGASDAAMPDDAIAMSEEAAALANVRTMTVGTGDGTGKTVTLYGKVAPDERTRRTITAQFAGRINALKVDFTGRQVKRGEVMATIYSPELYTAQQELLEAKKLSGVQPQLLSAARERLKLWQLTDAQIAAIEQSGKASPTIDVEAPASGTVITRRVSEGDYVAQGTVLFEIADLSRVWLLFQAYESDLPFLKVGNALSFTVNALPGRTFTGKVDFIDPVLNAETRTVSVRVPVANADGALKPEMVANASIEARLPQYESHIAVPRSAVLWTGKRSVVYVRLTDYTQPVFRLREVTLGPALDDAYVILDGLTAGETVVTNGTFAIDAAAQLEGKPSMMNRTAETPAPTQNVAAHSHASHDASNQASHTTSNSAATQSTSSEHAAPTPAEKPASTIKSATLKVKGLCGSCKRRIEAAARAVEGVTAATWTSSDGKLALTFDSARTDIRAISKAVAAVGHDTDYDHAPDDVYAALPGCCKYREAGAKAH